MFWTWNSFIAAARDVFKNYFTREILRDYPKKLSMQSPPRDCKLKVLHEEKLERITSAKHVEPGYCHWGIPFSMHLREIMIFA